MTSPDLKLEITSNPNPADVETVMQQLRQFNWKRAGEGDYQPLVLFLRDSTQTIVGGLLGETYWQWLYVDIFWLAESCRGQGYGTTMLSTAEQEAIQRGCHQVYLDTFSFQALQFYQKQGYQIFGELPNFPPGHSRYFLTKPLQPLSE